MNPAIQILGFILITIAILGVFLSMYALGWQHGNRYMPPEGVLKAAEEPAISLPEVPIEVSAFLAPHTEPIDIVPKVTFDGVPKESELQALQIENEALKQRLAKVTKTKESHWRQVKQLRHRVNALTLGDTI